jgi:hypothetical protein
MEPIKIDKNVPIPKGRHNAKYPWKELEVGDSFFIPGKDAKSTSGIKRSAKNSAGIDILTRAVTENGVNGMRVWRFA